MTVRRHVINFANKSVDYRVGVDALEELPRYMKGVVKVPYRALAVADEASWGRIGQTVERSLIDAGFTVGTHILPADENSATLAHAMSLFERLASLGITKDDVVVCVGDEHLASLVCWVCRSWLGGTPCAVIPTTLNAMLTVATQLDGLSVGEDEPMVELQPEPELVVADLALLKENSQDQLRLGYVTMVQAMLTDSRKKWDEFPDLISGILAGSEITLLNAIAQTLAARKDVVRGTAPAARTGLTFGYTTAYALRSLLGNDVPWYSLLAEGMRFEARVATDAVNFKVEDVFSLDDCLEDLGVEEVPFELDVDAFIEALHAARFSRANQFMLAIPSHVGSVRLAVVDEDILKRHAGAYLASRADLL